MIKRLLSYLQWVLIDKPTLIAQRDGEIRLIYLLQKAAKTSLQQADREAQQIVAHYNYLLHTLTPNQSDDYPGWIPPLSVERFQAQLMKSGITLTYKRIPSEEMIDAHSNCR